jgi:hypothetical protein
MQFGNYESNEFQSAERYASIKKVDEFVLYFLTYFFRFE